MKPNEIKTLFDYNFWAFERVWDCISQISDEQFLEEVDYSTGSIRNIVVHMMSANRNWVSRLQGIETPPRLVFEDFNMMSTTKAKWDELHEEFLDYLTSLNQEQLEEIVNWELPARGVKCSNSRWEILLHVANHATDHRAQILAILHHHFHVKTVEQDMILYLAEQR
ncbi:MAG TPA: DinB family protein [Anaerolineales bacterium]|nr:DinB family protein [Anaerolineales bacterium]